MHIIKAFFQFTNITAKRAQSLFKQSHEESHSNSNERPDERPASASSYLLSTSSGPPTSNSNASLTDQYEDFSHSYKACFFHATFYYGVAVLGFTLIENLSIIDSLYSATIIFTTIGYGDIVPFSTFGMLFTLFLASYGIVILSIFLGIAGKYEVETQNKLSAEKERERNEYVIGSIRKQDGNVHQVKVSNDNAMLKKQIKAATPIWKDIRRIIILEAPTVGVVLAMGSAIGYVEGWTIGQSIYWSAISGFTIGFGGFAPVTATGRLACVFFLPFAVTVRGEMLARIAASYMTRQRAITETQFFRRALTHSDLQKLDGDSGDVLGTVVEGSDVPRRDKDIDCLVTVLKFSYSIVLLIFVGTWHVYAIEI